MSATVTIHINDRAIAVREGTSVAAALAQIDATPRRSVRGERRFAVCGMGVCAECRVRIDGVAHRLACQTFVREGMRIVCDD